MTVQLSEASLTLAGVLLITLVAVEYGGTFLLRVSTGRAPATDLQRRFYRAGHAHAGMLVTLALVVQPFVAAAGLSGGWELLARSGVAWAAVLMPAGFFLSAAGRGRTEPTRLVLLVRVGAAVLAASVLTLGIGLLS
ncbi:MAG TPA: hypothetical protein VEZ42_00655 [Pseudonocardia sp.]|nr:hypothetical protein [Pseudonocardia sp.]